MALSLFRTIATAAHAKLTTILQSEGRVVPDLVFGNVPLEEQDGARRIAWFQDGGRIVMDPLPTTSADPEAPVTPPIAIRRATARIGISAPFEDEVEHVCDRLMLACRQLDDDARHYGRLFHWADASYDYPTQMVGAPLKNGVHIISLRVPLDLPVAGEPDGATELVTVADHQIRVGIANPPTEPDATVEFDLNRWTP